MEQARELFYAILKILAGALIAAAVIGILWLGDALGMAM